MSRRRKYNKMGQICNVMMVVDGEYLYDSMISEKRAFSLDKDNPQQIWFLNDKSNYQFLVAPKKFVENKQASSDLALTNLRRHDEISFRATTVDGNSDFTAIIYDIKRTGEVQVTGHFTSEIETITEAALPSDGYTPGSSTPFWHHGVAKIAEFCTTLVSTGTENYEIYFALFMTKESSDKQELVGYFTWDPKITVH